MTTYEVAQLFKQYVDDADATFMSEDDAVVFLNQGYREFYSLVAENDSNFYVATAVYANVNAKFIDLATTPATLPAAAIIMGQNVTATDKRLYRLMRVSQCETNGNVRYYLQPCRSLVELRNDVNRYMLRGKELLFSDVVQNISLEYVGIEDSKFSLANITTTAAADFIDDLVQFHDLIALFACKHYMIKDFATNPVLVQQMELRMKAINEYLSTGRSFSANNAVIGTDELTYLGY